MMLPTDMCLLEDAAFRPHVERFAKDEAAFREEFAVAYTKLLHLGCPFGKKTASPHNPPLVKLHRALGQSQPQALRALIRCELRAILRGPTFTSPTVDFTDKAVFEHQLTASHLQTPPAISQASEDDPKAEASHNFREASQHGWFGKLKALAPEADVRARRLATRRTCVH